MIKISFLIINNMRIFDKLRTYSCACPARVIIIAVFHYFISV